MTASLFVNGRNDATDLPRIRAYMPTLPRSAETRNGHVCNRLLRELRVREVDERIADMLDRIPDHRKDPHEVETTLVEALLEDMHHRLFIGGSDTAESIGRIRCPLLVHRLRWPREVLSRIPPHGLQPVIVVVSLNGLLDVGGRPFVAHVILGLLGLLGLIQLSDKVDTADNLLSHGDPEVREARSRQRIRTSPASQ
eukprot:CAMPEP_0176056222 /NCGR_PEP_ID=MMETSP0120_2-20121206/27996_1 /TAXON_ID=160619 /ORGANISM="Kryptoperidinium foliaceum, Strain CCMP 1326" /LENGTH=196 /DNA_ID=CAMNT_0017389725 /DNA_START=272 /DNA_END=864 /DNA_ORIENTATION=+